MNDLKARILKSVKDVVPGTVKTCIWIIKLTLGVSFMILLLRYFNILPWISSALEPIFSIVGLPGEAALVYVTGYFANIYSAIAVLVTLDLDTRAITILSAMVLCSHNMIVETAVQKKTGTSATRMVIIRTLSGIIIALVLNAIMPGSAISVVSKAMTESSLDFWTMFKEWLPSMVVLSLKMSAIIVVLNVVQRLLSEFGVIRMLSKLLRPLLGIFGLPARCSFLWIIANVIGLAYGAAAMIDEVKNGKLKKQDIDLTNIHISISHSNLEDLFILSAIGGVWWILLLSRWIMSIILVWLYRFELMIRNKCLTLPVEIKNNESRKN